MNLVNSSVFKLSRTYWLTIMIVLPVLYGLLLYWYLGRYDNPRVIFYDYAVYFNCLLPSGIALMISLYTQYEAQIGHFNHLLQIARRGKWLLTMIGLTWLSVGVSTLISCVPLWLLLGGGMHDYMLYYLVLTTLFSLPAIIILWFVSLKINMEVCLGLGVFLSLFAVLYGAQGLGNTIWPYVPFLYGTRYLFVVDMTDTFSISVFGIFTAVSGLLLAGIIYWFNRWEGRTINE